MEISHVLRADEWLSSTPRHILLYDAMSWRPPNFAHLPMILGPDKSKLSKRHGATSVAEYEQQGYLPEALFNFLALLGWSLDDKTEIMSRTEIVNNFSLDRISTTAAVFNREKLDWMNGVYIRNLTIAEFSQRVVPFLERGFASEVSRPLDNDYIGKVMPLIQERARTLAEIPELTEFFFNNKLDYDADHLLNKIECDQAINTLRTSLCRVEGLATWDSDSLERVFRPLADELQLKTGVLFGLLRVAVTGRTAAPPLFQTMEVLGKETCVIRIRAALTKLRM
jgi:glutamyl-tRNA synthetase